MNEKTGSAAPLVPFLVAVVGAALGGGCANPFATVPDDLGPRIPVERILAVDPLDINEYSDPERKAPTEQELRERIVERFSRSRFEGLDKVIVTLEEARAWTLRNNLDLRVALIDPVIANQAISFEEGRFDQVFFSNLRRTETDQPTSTALVGTQIENTNFDAGVRVPLRTGGTVQVSFPVRETSNNNPFTVLDPAVSTDPAISITQPLLRNAGRRANTHGIRVAALQSGISLARTKLEVIRQLANADRAYWRLYAARRALEVTQQQYELAMAQLERARRRVRAGQDAEIEIIRSEEGVGLRLGDIIVAENGVLQQQRDLKRIVNEPGVNLGDALIVVPGTDPDPVPYTFKSPDLVQQALANRMEMLELELQLAIDESAIAFQRNQALPDFVVDYTYNLSGLGTTLSESLEPIRNSTFSSWSLGFRFETSLQNQTARASLQEAILRRLQRLSTVEARRLAIEQETLDVIDRLNAGWQRILAARQSVLLAARTLQAEQRQFDVGARTSTDVLDAATRLANAQLEEIRAITDYQIAQVDLAFATGTLLGAARVDWLPLDPRGEPRDSSEASGDMYSARMQGPEALPPAEVTTPQ